MIKYDNTNILKTVKIPMTNCAKEELGRMMSALNPAQAVRFAKELRSAYNILLSTTDHTLFNGGDLFRAYDNRQKYE